MAHYSSEQQSRDAVLSNTEQLQKQRYQEEEETEAFLDDPWIALGGGAVNERERQQQQKQEQQQPQTSTIMPVAPDSNHRTYYQPKRNKSHLWHSLEGLDRYPNYLHRWNEEDISLLETALEDRLNQVRKQKNALKDRNEKAMELIQQLTTESKHDTWTRLVQGPRSWEQIKKEILDQDIANAIFSKSKMFSSSYDDDDDDDKIPSLDQVLRGKVDVELDASALVQVMEEELPDVYSFQLLSRTFCDQVREYIKEFIVSSQKQARYADLLLGRRPVDLDMVGLGWLNDLLFHLVIRPISRHLFRNTDIHGELDWRHGFVAGYSVTPGEGTPRERLVTHTDDAEVTLNICIGEEFEGGALEFRGYRGSARQGELKGVYEPQHGKAILHAGRYFHDVTQVTAGNRYALVVWTRSWQGIRANTCPCCWLNRRQDKSCICGVKWN